jgi:pilus assembly protein CpaF
MLGLVLRYEDGTVESRDLALPFDVGRMPHCGLHLRAWRVARRHARFYDSGAGIMVEDFGSLCGTLVNGRRVTQYGPLNEGDEVLIGPCLICVARMPGPDVAPEACRHGADTGVADASGVVDTPEDTPDPRAGERIDVKALSCAGGAGLHDRLRHRRRLHGALLEALDLRRRDIAVLSDEALRMQASEVLAGILAVDAELPPGIDQGALLREVLDEAVGLGPLEPLLADPGISEIMVNRHDECFWGCYNCYK